MSRSRPQPLPRPGLDPINTAAAALAVFRAATSRPYTDQIIILPVDSDRVARTIVVINEVGDADAIVECVHVVATASAHHGLDTIICGSARRTAGVVPDDFDRWFDAWTTAEELGVEILDWIVFSACNACSVPEVFGVAPPTGWCGLQSSLRH